MNDKAKKELERIEYKNRTWINDLSRKQSIWDEIALNFCSSKGNDLKYWGLVMDLYHEKYRKIKK